MKTSEQIKGAIRNIIYAEEIEKMTVLDKNKRFTAY